ncbi:MAG: helix-turn-helix transcriptional regulator, partial [Synergistaceae bacterium]|nr:helix-turn-helix transcriptional regulator [Synergistaceae bacterium]
MNLAEKIKQCRRAKNLTQAELAKIIEVSPITERRWEWNERKPRADELAKLADALGTTTDYLMGEDEPPQPSEESQLKQLLDSLSGLTA